MSARLVSPIDKRPTLTGWKPSTSLRGATASSTRVESICAAAAIAPGCRARPDRRSAPRPAPAVPPRSSRPTDCAGSNGSRRLWPPCPCPRRRSGSPGCRRPARPRGPASRRARRVRAPPRRPRASTLLGDRRAVEHEGGSVGHQSSLRRHSAKPHPAEDQRASWRARSAGSSTRMLGLSNRSPVEPFRIAVAGPGLEAKNGAPGLIHNADVRKVSDIPS